jgi:hypothetical protein
MQTENKPNKPSKISILWAFARDAVTFPVRILVRDAKEIWDELRSRQQGYLKRSFKLAAKDLWLPAMALATELGSGAKAGRIIVRSLVALAICPAMMETLKSISRNKPMTKERTLEVLGFCAPRTIRKLRNYFNPKCC